MSSPKILNEVLFCDDCEEDTSHEVENGTVYCIECGCEWGHVGDLPEGICVPKEDV